MVVGVGVENDEGILISLGIDSNMDGIMHKYVDIYYLDICLSICKTHTGYPDMTEDIQKFRPN